MISNEDNIVINITIWTNLNTTIFHVIRKYVAQWTDKMKGPVIACIEVIRHERHFYHYTFAPEMPDVFL